LKIPAHSFTFILQNKNNQKMAIIQQLTHSFIRRLIATVICITFLFITNKSNGQQYVKVNNICGFSVNNTSYKPLVCNYLISFKQNSSGAWYISTHWNHSKNYHCLINPENYPHVYYSDLDATQNYTAGKLVNDLIKIKNLGFTEIRLCGAGLEYDANANSFVYPTNESIASGGPIYFSLLDNFMDTLANNNLRAIFLLGGDSKLMKHHMDYTMFLKTVGLHYQNNTSIMAYDLFNEPNLSLWFDNVDCKFNFAKMVNEWNLAIKTSDPNHLTTVGIINFDKEPNLMYDPHLLQVDFVSEHFYKLDHDMNLVKNNMDVTYYWHGKTTKIPWIIGETGYSANNSYYNPNNPNIGTEANQLDFAVHVLPKSVHCNCKGFSWWQFQDIFSNGENDSENYFGLYYWGLTPNTPGCGPYSDPYQDGTYKPIADPFNSPFLNYQGTTQNTLLCSQPANYYSIFNGPSPSVSGYVVDIYGNKTENAVITGKWWNNDKYQTFTDANGYFSLKGSGNGSPYNISITYPGFTSISKDYPLTSDTYTIEKVSQNGWMKQWTNKNNSGGLLKVVSGASSDWIIGSSDKYYRGDFNGDAREDLLCVQYSGSSYDRMALFTFEETLPIVPGTSNYNIVSGWRVLWDNQSNFNNGGGIYPYRNNLIIGDFDGNGTDDVYGMVNGWVTWFTFVPNANPNSATWFWQDSNYGAVNDPNKPMSWMVNYNYGIVAGNFYGNTNGKDAIIASTGSGGWITSFQVENGVWTWIQSNMGQTNNPSPGYAMSYLTPFNQQFIAGDYDGDGQDELLGNALPGGAMAVFKAMPPSGNGEWSWQQKWYDSNGYISGIGPYRNRLNVGNFASDNSDEILGMNSSYTAVFKFVELNQPLWTLTWEGSYYPVIADLQISPNFIDGTKYLFINTNYNSSNAYKLKQQHLLSINPNTKDANLYAFRLPNPTNNCASLRMAQNLPIRPQEISVNGELVVYPNPNGGSFQIKIPSSIFPTRAQGTIRIMDLLGREVFAKTVIEGDILQIDLTSKLKGVFFVRYNSGTNAKSAKIVIE
jgi:hypothetical protein